MEEYRFKDRKSYAEALDRFIMEDDVQERSLGDDKPKHRYLPIPLKDAIADYIFQYWNVIDEKYIPMDGFLVSTIKLVYVPDYPGADEIFCTGSAAVLLNKAKNNLEFQLPSVRSEAIGNAFGSLGNIFGRNLSRVLKKGINIPDEFSLRKKEKEEKGNVPKMKNPPPPPPKEKDKPDIPF